MSTWTTLEAWAEVLPDHEKRTVECEDRARARAAELDELLGVAASPPIGSDITLPTAPFGDAPYIGLGYDVNVSTQTTRSNRRPNVSRGRPRSMRRS
jgi:hypothetical protein